ncbi:DUF6398 domain-containing protein [Desulfogranum japonicum]|uniref:DUF6398 domain-containing protein n=1 Tax=Desulfogranum japonicum TaxID=231447 RepID=UPI00048E10B9|nr:DUF6398 domain-containing protein [Desulfogranum japonicum]
MAHRTHSENVPAAMRDIYTQIVGLTDTFSSEYLTPEYAQLIRYATAALCRKRPSPLLKGKANTWACGITHAIGFVNFLFDRSQEPSMSATDLYAAFGVGKSTGGAKSKIVRDLLDMYQLDPNWCLPSKLDENSRAWMITVNGFILDARSAPRNIQEAAYAKGLIPYIPE